MSIDLKKLALTLHPLERKVLPLLEKHTRFEDIVGSSGLQQVEVMRALQWLSNKRVLDLHEELKEMICLEENAERYRKEGLPEKRFLQALIGSLSIPDLKKKTGLSDEELTVCMGLLRRGNAISIEKKGTEIIISPTESGKALASKELPEEKLLSRHFPLEAKSLTQQEREIVISLRSRKKFLRSELAKTITITLEPLGRSLLKENLSDAVADKLTPGMLRSDAWKTASLRRYDVSTNVSAIYGGRRHFVEQSISYIKRIWLDLGFEEMEGKMVQTAFWDLDALFVPQDHPAREMQDTFYVKDPSAGKLPKELASRIKAMHENGGKSKSRGWGYKWSEETAKQNLLRTHTTVLSAQTLARLKKEQLPAKFFSVGKVFRNEALSWKHLFEFIQVEGIVVDPNANFKHLKGYLREFFMKMGFEDVRIRPGHFPYTEPSAEVDVWHPIKKTWVELGGSGIFRPEVVEPLLGEAIPVLAWGIGMERSIVEYYGISDVRDVYKNDLKQLRESRLWVK